MVDIMGLGTMSWLPLKDQFHCEFDRCKFDGLVFTAMGCLDQHITERVYCLEHDGILSAALRRGAETCHCGGPIILAESVKTHLIDIKIWDKLLRDQQARQVAALIAKQVVPGPIKAHVTKPNIWTNPPTTTVPIWNPMPNPFKGRK